MPIFNKSIKNIIFFQDEITTDLIKNKYPKLFKHWSALFPLRGGFNIPNINKFNGIQNRTIHNVEYKYWLSNFTFLSSELNNIFK